ncbi:MAG: Glucose-1-phosphate cytidylyltransferase [Verrucomicrobiae bacterium]|nr:Glucose-1-phosphate cytidylyltransferase [Verrucomicrobiae bacterium]
METNNVTVVIFCGGRGTRFSEQTELRPKPLIEVGDRPILWHIMKIYSHYGFHRFVLPVGYKGAMIKDYFLNYESRNRDFTIHLGGGKKPAYLRKHDEGRWQVSLVDTGVNTMTGARLSRIRKHIKTRYLMLTYGDGVGNIDLQRLLTFHKNHGKIATVTGVHPPSRFGELVCRGNQVQRFSEKPQVSEGIINGGFFVFDTRVFDYVTDDETLTFEREPLTQLAADGELMVYRHTGFWQPMDTYRDWQILNDAWQTGKAPWKFW